MDEKLTDAIEKGNEALAWYTSDNYPETSTCYINSGTLKTLIRAASTPPPIVCAEKLSDEDIEKLKNPACGYVVAVDSTPSAEVEYWKDKCYTAESDAEIHAQCHDKVFDEKKALEAEVQALREALRGISMNYNGKEPIAADMAREALNQPHTGGK